jgi:hypothetical protein
MENQILLEKIGETKTNNLIQDVSNIFKENLLKQYPDYFLNKNILKSLAILTTTDKNEIKNIGMSCLNDLLTDNFGSWFGGFIYPTSIIVMKDQSSVDHDILMWGGGTWNINNGGGDTGTRIMVGSGTATATRQDIDMTNFEQELNSGDGGWNSSLGQVDAPATIPSTVASNLSEVGLFGSWFAQSPSGVFNFMLSHDNISPVVPVIIGQTINVDYKIFLS